MFRSIAGTAIAALLPLLAGLGLQRPAPLVKPFAPSPAIASPAPMPAPQAPAARTWQQVGLASWYGPGANGHETTSGERFNMYGLTAAHRSLPLGTIVKITNLCNLRTVVLRINDRGPNVRHRLIDVSYAAARLLGFKAAGLVPVRVELLRPRTPPPQVIAEATAP
jgi:rare lipoprotein A